MVAAKSGLIRRKTPIKNKFNIYVAYDASLMKLSDKNDDTNDKKGYCRLKQTSPNRAVKIKIMLNWKDSFLSIVLWYKMVVIYKNNTLGEIISDKKGN